MTRLAEMLRLYRTVRGASVRDVASTANISAATISRIERGHAMDAETLLKMLNWMLSDIQELVR